MKIFKQIIILFILCCLGDIISLFLPIPFPGSVIALVLLFLCLISGLVKTQQIELLSEFLLKNMTLLFIPPTVSIVAYIDVFKGILWQFLFICIATTVITFFATAYSVKLTMYLLSKAKGGQNNAE